MYDLNGDGVITKDEMEDVTASVDNHDFSRNRNLNFFAQVYQLMGVNTEWEGLNQVEN